MAGAGRSEKRSVGHGPHTIENADTPREGSSETCIVGQGPTRHLRVPTRCIDGHSCRGVPQNSPSPHAVCPPGGGDQGLVPTRPAARLRAPLRRQRAQRRQRGSVGSRARGGAKKTGGHATSPQCRRPSTPLPLATPRRATETQQRGRREWGAWVGGWRMGHEHDHGHPTARRRQLSEHKTRRRGANHDHPRESAVKAGGAGPWLL